MGRKKYRSFVGGTLPEQQWKDLIVATALLLGADSHTRQPMDNPTLRTFSYPHAHMWQRMQKWLWHVHGMNVRRDGTIYQRPPEEQEQYVEEAQHPQEASERVH